MNWDISNIDKNDNCTVYRISDDGEGTIKIYKIFPGVYTMYYNFDLQQCSLKFPKNSKMLCINYCREGIIEWGLDNDKSTFIKTGEVQISVQSNICSDFWFPINYYRGITVYLYMDEMHKNLFNIMEGFSIDLHKLKEKFCIDDYSFVMRAEGCVQEIFSEMYKLPEMMQIQYLKIKVSELLLSLEIQEVPKNTDKGMYLNKTQVQKIRRITDFLTSDLENRHTLEEMSERFNFPLTSMKLCFKGIYGSSIFAYMKAYRMHIAAQMLKNSNESILSIAGKVGYDNASKFAAAFRSVIGFTPSEYRRL